MDLRAEQWSSRIRTKLSEEGTQTAFLFTQPEAELGRCQPCTASSCACMQHFPGTPRQGLQRPLIRYGNLFFFLSLVVLPGSLPWWASPRCCGCRRVFTDTLFPSKHGRGLSSTPQPAAQGYQLSHPDAQITNELTAPASRHAELEGGNLRWAGVTCPAPRWRGSHCPASLIPKSMFLAQPGGLCSGEQTESTLTASTASGFIPPGLPCSLFPFLAWGTGTWDKRFPLPANPR